VRRVILGDEVSGVGVSRDVALDNDMSENEVSGDEASEDVVLDDIMAMLGGRWVPV
jgi:hypothetical protein